MADEQLDLTLDDYQDLALTTWKRTPGDQVDDLAYLALGLNGEAGEVAEHIKKRRHGKEIDRDAIKKELGDLLWYAAVMAYELGFSLEDVAADNIAKLRARYPAGFVQRWGSNGR